MKRIGLSAAFFAGLVLLWEVAYRAGLWSPVLLPGPLEVVQYLRDATLDGTLPAALLRTLQRLLIGYSVGVVLGVPLGMLLARYRWAQDTLGVVALGLQTLPSVCWAPLAILWFGQSESAMFFIVLMGSLWSIALATESGVRAIPPIYARAAATMGSRGLHAWTHVLLPAALPSIVGGMKQGWAFAWRSLMAAEVYISVISGMGLGQLLNFGRELHAMEAVLGVMLTIVLVGLAADRLVFGRLERQLRARWGLAG